MEDDHRMQIIDEGNITNYIIHYQYGKDDLKSIYPYADTEWEHTWSPSIPYEEKDYLSNPQAYVDIIKKLNSEYITELKEEGRYLVWYTMSTRMVKNPLFDDNKTIRDSGLPLSSYKMYILDIGDYNGENNETLY